jgi:hypothetical protein
MNPQVRSTLLLLSLIVRTSERLTDPDLLTERSCVGMVRERRWYAGRVAQDGEWEGAEACFEEME